jgi:hypothetical protein
MRYFNRSDFDCQETGNNEMSDEFLWAIDALRHECGFPFIITSGYRDPTHSIEARKAKPGTHAQGIAADIRITDGNQAYKIIETAQSMGFNGIGVAKLSKLLAVFFESLNALAVGAPFAPGFRIFSLEPAAMRFRLACMFAYKPFITSLTCYLMFHILYNVHLNVR